MFSPRNATTLDTTEAHESAYDSMRCYEINDEVWQWKESEQHVENHHHTTHSHFRNSKFHLSEKELVNLDYL